jgi:hypothetical protein
MDLFYDERDDAAHEARGSRILYWLDDLDAKPLGDAKAGDLLGAFRPLKTIQID